MERGAKPHAVCIPFPAQGHIRAMLNLAKLLHFKGFHITFVHSESIYHRIFAGAGAGDPSPLLGLDDFRFEFMSGGFATPESAIFADNPSKAAPFRDLLNRLNEPSASGVPPVTCIVSDVVTSFTLDVAEELGIPDVFFCSASACGYMGYLQYNELQRRGLVPLQSEDDLSNGYLDTIIDWIPGMKNMRLKDLPSFLRTTDPDNILFNRLKNEAEAGARATAIIINTFDELEATVLNAMSSVLPPIYTLGPMTSLCHQILGNSLEAIGSNNLWKEDDSCLKWLEGKAPGSVIYVSFGSTEVITNQQLNEFAWGLSNSGHDFLWVIRPNATTGGPAVLSKEFLDEAGERCFQTSWCPQEEVLVHPSIGGFMTHSGWNSTMESICAGVPMICWPCSGDQQTNCRYACNEWGVGMEVDRDAKREEVERLIGELMNGEKGRRIKEKASQWKEAAFMATKAGGNSFMNLDRLIEEVLLERKE